MPNFVTGFLKRSGDAETDLNRIFGWTVELIDELQYIFNNLDSGNVVEAAKVKDKVMTVETLIADTVITDTLYAEYGEIADLTVNKISTSHRIYKYLTQDITDDLYFEGYENGIYCCQGCVKMIEGVPLTEQLLNHDGRPLYWQKPIASTMGGKAFDEDGVRIGLTTKNTGVPCIVYSYTVLTKAMFSYWQDENGVQTPVICMGAGDGNTEYVNSGKGFIYKDTAGIQMEYHRQGKLSQVYLGDDGNVFTYQTNDGGFVSVEMDEDGGRLVGDWSVEVNENSFITFDHEPTAADFTQEPQDGAVIIVYDKQNPIFL